MTDLPLTDPEPKSPDVPEPPLPSLEGDPPPSDVPDGLPGRPDPFNDPGE